MNNLNICEIFKSIQGEGRKSGAVTTFIRLSQCNLKCNWCDTVYSQNNENSKSISIDNIINKVRELKAPNCCITGGEPLIQMKGLIRLIEKLSSVEFLLDIHIETNGSYSLAEISELRKKSKNKIRFIMDYKLPSSGMTSLMNIENFDYLSEADELKFVVASRKDFEDACDILKSYTLKPKVLFSPVFGDIEVDELAKWVIDLSETVQGVEVYLNIQIHKIIWDKNARGV